MRTIAFLSILLTFASAPAAAQELSNAERGRALGRVRALAACVERHHEQLERVLRLIAESEQQRDRARDARVRQDAERAIEALIAQAAHIQREARTCVGGADLPSPGTRVVERGPPPDPAAESVAESGGTVRAVERDVRLSDTLTIVRGEQVDGEGRVDDGAVRRAIRSIAPTLERCYERYLDRGSLQPRELDLVFTLRGSGRPHAVAVERSSFADATFERCVRGAGQRLRVSGAPRGGGAVYGYTFRFGRSSRAD